MNLWSRMACLAALIAGSAAVVMSTTAADDGPPYSPSASMATMQIDAGYAIEAVANEPDIASPVAMDIDEYGRLFVVEMPGYPLDTRPTGRVRLLEDADGDGRYERSRVFADGLVLPTGVMRWKRGVLVTAAPDLLYLEDADEDGRAETRRVILTGFAQTNPQHTVNTPLYGLDNWIYLAHEGHAEAIIYKDLFGDRGHPLTWPEHPERPAIDPRGRGVRLRIEQQLVERLSGGSQYGHGFDRWGHYFTNDNANHARHEVIAARHLTRNTNLLLPTPMQDIPDHGSAARVFPITKRPTFELLTESGQFTSACAITPYEGSVLFTEREGGMPLLVAEPVHNLVHLDEAVPSGPTFVARRTRDDREFLAAGDSWFRPVFLYTGPDGALYVVDYYRPRIEHPEWGASDVQKDPTPLYEGQERGRIYRVTRAGAARVAARVSLGDASDETLVGELANPNLWWRRTAQRLLVDRQARGAASLLRAQAQGASPVGRVHALWTLEGLGSLDPELVERALGDEVAGVRENAVTLAEARLADRPALAARLVAMEHDPDPRVRFAVLAALGSLSTNEAAAARDRMLIAHIDDRWMQVAALSAGAERAGTIFAGATAAGSPVLSQGTPARAGFLEQVSAMIAASSRPAGIHQVLAIVSDGRACGGGARAGSARPRVAPDAWWRAAALRGLATGARGHEAATAALASCTATLLELHDEASAEVREASYGLLQLLPRRGGPAWKAAVTRAVALAEGRANDPVVRADAIALVSLDAPGRRVAWFERFLSPRESEPVQRAAVRALGRVPASAAPDLGTTLLARWPAMTPPVRSEAADVLLHDERRTRQLIAAMRAGTVQPWTLDFWQKRDLVMHENREIRADARALLEEDPRRRADTVRRYAAALDLAGSAERGQAVFARACASCHRLGAEPGGDLGPDLATVRHRPPLNLLGDILLPSQAIAQHYETYVIERRTGHREAGVLASQTPQTITLRQGQDRTITIRRSDIRSMAVAPQSSMPADLDKVIAPDEIADLLAFIRGQ